MRNLISYCGFIDKTLGTNEIENIFICLIALWISSLFEVFFFFFLFQYFVQFRVGSSSVIHLSALLDVHAINVLSHLIVFLFSLLMVSSDE